MRIGVPRELKTEEYRVALTPSGIERLVKEGNLLFVEYGAGSGAGFLDEEYVEMGAKLLPRDSLWETSDLIVKVKEPIPEEYPFLREGLILFTYLHLAAHPELTDTLLKYGVAAFGYETVMERDGLLPLLRPMSEIAGSLSIQAGARGLEKTTGGEGVLLPRVSSIPPSRVVIAGAGTAGSAAARVATGIGAHVTVLDIREDKLKMIQDITGKRAHVRLSSPETLSETLRSADLLVLSVLVPGATAPRIISREMVSSMKVGACIVDISIDQGGASETSRPTTHADPYYLEDGVVHYCVSNIPAAVPRTATTALSSATLPYISHIALEGVWEAIKESHPLSLGLNTIHGKVTCRGVAESLGKEYFSPGDLV